jgi:UDP-N-acetylglucosamine diphosphorylase/glucosamine-1-phosphate N-acetyltransferase
MSIILFDNDHRKNLFPATITQSFADIRLGILTIKEWWQLLLKENLFVKTEDYLQNLYEEFESEVEHLFINSCVLPVCHIIQKILALNSNEALMDDEVIIAFKTKTKSILIPDILKKVKIVDNRNFVTKINNPSHLFQLNNQILNEQFTLVTKNKVSQKISSSNVVIHSEDIFIEEGATIEHCILNASTGFIYVGKNATLMEGSIIRGGCAILDNAVVKCGTKIYGATTIGKNCVVGGEIKNSVISDYSNKAHDGYLGDSFIGKWCNIGAGTSNSNVKNNASDVYIWNQAKNQTINVGKKCGVIMGDYSRIAINSSINTGSSFGVCCNIFGEGLLPKQINHFSWGLHETYKIEKVITDINNWMYFKGEKLSEKEITILKYIFANNINTLK